MSRRRIGQETFGLGDGLRRQSSLDELAKLLDWVRVEAQLVDVSSSAKGEPAWPPLALFKALLLSVWYDLSDVKLAEALDDRASFRRFCGFSATRRRPSAPRSCAFARPWRFARWTSCCSTRSPANSRPGDEGENRTLVDATIHRFGEQDDDDGHWVKHKGKPAVMVSRRMSAPTPKPRCRRSRDHAGQRQ